ncbi:MAG: LicD family protein [Bacilli bacterium]|nr:LicD family protein [Bacilli bacterium]
MSNYIKGEDVLIPVRNNKKVSLNKIHKEILTIMDEIDRICRKHNITYGFIAGSALGMVNYGGFIPWDDDIDVFILRSDWDKFIQALDKELGDDFYYHCYEKNKRYNILIPQMKVRKKNTYVEEENFLLDNRCSGNGIFVDIVTYGDINDNKFIDEVYRTIMKVLMIPLVFIDNLGFNPRLLKMIAVKIDNRYDKISKGSSLISQPVLIPWEKFRHEPVFKKEDVLPVKEYEFEGRKYYSYNNIEKVLKSWYGDNCLKKWNESKLIWEETLPVEKRNSKHMKDVDLNRDNVFKKEKVMLNLLTRIIFYIILFLLLGIFIDIYLDLFVVILLFIISLFCTKIV